MQTQSYSSVVSGVQAQHPQSQQPDQSRGPRDADRQTPSKRSTSPAHSPKTTDGGEDVFVLTLLTDKGLHQRMTKLRERYFPKRINKLAAHLTLFHALPRSKLDSSIIPVIEDVASKTTAFKVHAGRPFRLRRGIAISVAKHQGGQQAQDVHRSLQQPWLKADFLSEQDAGGCKVHYTIMNKVDDDLEVSTALKEVEREWKGDNGVAEGLGLWRYERGWWKFERKFAFQAEHS